MSNAVLQVDAEIRRDWDALEVWDYGNNEALVPPLDLLEGDGGHLFPD